jgi:hypothetical protein
MPGKCGRIIITTIERQREREREREGERERETITLISSVSRGPNYYGPWAIMTEATKANDSRKQFKVKYDDNDRRKSKKKEEEYEEVVSRNEDESRKLNYQLIEI